MTIFSLLTIAPIIAIIFIRSQMELRRRRRIKENERYELEIEQRAEVVYDFYTHTGKLPKGRELKDWNGKWFIQSTPPKNPAGPHSIITHSPTSCNSWITPNGYHCGNIQSPITITSPQSFDVSADYLTNPNLTTQCKLDISTAKFDNIRKEIISNSESTYESMSAKLDEMKERQSLIKENEIEMLRREYSEKLVHAIQTKDEEIFSDVKRIRDRII